MEALPELGLVYLSSGEFFRLKAETAAKVEGGALFPDAEYIETISPAVDEQIRLADQLQPGFVFDGGVRKVFQAPAVKRMFAVRGYQRFVLIRFDFDDWSSWDTRRQGRLKQEGRPDDEFGPASTKLVSYLINERAVLKACSDAGYEIYHINAGGTVLEVNNELITVLKSL